MSQHKQKVHRAKKAPVAPSPQARVSSSAAHACRTCNRLYTSAGALQQHYRDTPAHPNCARCEIGFVDNVGLQAVSCSKVSPRRFVYPSQTSPKHTNSVHPPVPLSAFSCRTCNFSCPSASALKQHYLDSSVHPTCTKCNTGFVDNSAMQTVSSSRVIPIPFEYLSQHVPKHTTAVHPPISSFAFTCRICNLSYSSAVTLDQHYLDAPIHPKCTRCDIGFVDNPDMQAVSPVKVLRILVVCISHHLLKHVVSVHRPVTCGTCGGLKIYQEDVADHYRVSPRHPSCTICNIGFENQEAFDEVRWGAPTLPLTPQAKLTVGRIAA